MPTLVYASLGRELQVYQLDLASGALTLLQRLMMPQTIQYGWPNRARTMLYVATSGSGPMAQEKVADHFVQAFAILPTGALEPLAPPVRLGNRPLYLLARPHRGAPAHRLQ